MESIAERFQGQYMPKTAAISASATQNYWVFTYISLEASIDKSRIHYLLKV